MHYSVIGTGLMGSAVTRTLLSSGFETSVWNRTAERAEPLAAAGADVHADVSAAVVASDAVILLLLDADVARDVLGSRLQALAGKTVINLMSSTPAIARELAHLIADSGGRYLDGTIQCYPSDIGDSGALVNLSGSREVWDEHRDALTAVAGRSTYVGEDPGAASILDAALAGTFYTTALGALCEALAFLRDCGVDPARPETSLDYWLELFTSQAKGLVASLEREEFATADATVSIYVSAMKVWRDSMLAAGQRGSIMTAALENLEIAEAAGHGESGFISQVLTSTASA
jgi:3-hydroxyisobutyrate dehydrogenase-like beta-hydroxyacid dehydrogenase